MIIHREGYKIIAISVLSFVIINILSFYFFNGPWRWLALTILVASFLLLIFTVLFFRVPTRNLTFSENKIVAPADGKVVVIEEITDTEFFNDKRIQLSIFMSPVNVHLNRAPVSGTVVYNNYYKGKYLVAWHPKSSTLNERHSIVLENSNGLILVKQIAGAMAKRICNYALPGKKFEQGEEFGFIKFGSRVDVLLPLSAKIEVQLGQMVKCGITVLASFN
jgi:phosphatidylserine decarboxylase